MRFLKIGPICEAFVITTRKPQVPGRRRVMLTILTKNHSSRLGKRPNLIVLHGTEGIDRVGPLGEFFKRSANASSHIGIDNVERARYVPDERASWTLRDGNQESLNIEMCSYAGWGRDTWLQHRHMLSLASLQVAEWSLTYSIPIRRLAAHEIRRALAEDQYPGGVIDHWDYTKATGDGTHWDTGYNCPIDDVILPDARRVTWSGNASASLQIADPFTEDFMELPAFNPDNPDDVAREGESSMLRSFPLPVGRRVRILVQTGGFAANFQHADWTISGQGGKPSSRPINPPSGNPPSTRFDIQPDDRHEWTQPADATGFSVRVNRCRKPIQFLLEYV